MAEQRFNSGYSPIPEADTKVVGESMTEASHAKHCDINNIIRKYTGMGILDHVNNREAHYTDVSSCPDYHGALEIVRATEDMFSSMPAELRDRFGNDAGTYLEWINDPGNEAEAVELGLLSGNEQPPAEGGAGGASGSSQKTGPETPESPPGGEEAPRAPAP